MDGESTESPRERPSFRTSATRLIRAVALAGEGRKLVLAAIGLVISWSGLYGLERLMAGPDASTRGVSPFALSAGDAKADLLARRAGEAIVEPFLVLAGPFSRLFATGESWAAFGRAALAALWGVLVWGIVGGAIARMVAVQQATGERIGIGTALRFATRRASALIGAPLCPLIGLGFFAALCVPFGLLYRIPGNLGPTIAGGLAFVPLLLGLVMTLLIVGWAAGWPLMIATVAVEAEDAFDALSRSYSYVYRRPAMYAIHAILAWVLGAVGLVAVWMLAALAVHMARWGLAFGAPDATLGTYFSGDADAIDTAGAAHGFWIFLVRLLAHGWIYSYFFTATTAIYLLLRLEVDGKPLDDLAETGDEDQPFAPGPPIPPGDKPEAIVA